VRAGSRASVAKGLSHERSFRQLYARRGDGGGGLVDLRAQSVHTFASLVIAAGVNAKALSTYIGYAQIAITTDVYGHLTPGNEDEAASLLDAYRSRADSQARIDAVGRHRPDRADDDSDGILTGR
jgi:hypothetical protein